MKDRINGDPEMIKLDRIAKEYRKPDAGRRVDQKLIRLLVDNTIPWMTGPEILEMGSGDDQWTQRIIEHFGHSHLVDGSQTLINAARGKYGAKLTAHHSLFENLKPKRKFDTIIASLVLEHVENPAKVLAIASEWLKPQGHIIVIVPHADSLHRRLAVAMGLLRTTDELGPSDVQLGHRWVFTIPRIEAAIVNAGLQIVRKRGMLSKPLPQGMMTEFSDALLKGLMKLGDELPMEYACCVAFDCRRNHA
jgi:2-polyprenyl-3-methyl-5-hydroxy-6-metoxy-1,4-benzoquinol methylase